MPGHEERRSADHERGVMSAQITALEKRMDREATTVTEWIAQHKDDNEEAHEALLIEIREIKDNMSMYKHFWLFLKTFGLIGAAIMTFKFGDISAIWRVFTNG